MIDGKIIKATLRGTDIEVVFELSPNQYAHYRFLTNQRVEDPYLLDRIVVKKMSALLEHFK